MKVQSISALIVQAREEVSEIVSKSVSNADLNRVLFFVEERILDAFSLARIELGFPGVHESAGTPPEAPIEPESKPDPRTISIEEVIADADAKLRKFMEGSYEHDVTEMMWSKTSADNIRGAYEMGKFDARRSLQQAPPEPAPQPATEQLCDCGHTAAEHTLPGEKPDVCTKCACCEFESTTQTLEQLRGLAKYWRERTQQMQKICNQARAEYDKDLERLLQHATNVLVAFRMRANGARVYLFSDTFADDLETATSVSELRKAAKHHRCQGVDLLIEDPQQDAPINVLDAADNTICRGGGIFR